MHLPDPLSDQFPATKAGAQRKFAVDFPVIAIRFDGWMAIPAGSHRHAISRTWGRKTAKPEL
jgi:hypothetical protein